MDRISMNMETIRVSFEYGADLVESGEALVSIIDKLHGIQNGFRSVAFEAVSMKTALKALSEEGSLSSWSHFSDTFAKDHQVHVHVGLGWAIAQLDQPLWPLLEQIDASFRNRVADGYGYYHGMFRRRQYVVSQKASPETILARAFDQGIGRSLWYSCKGDAENITGIIAGFSEERHPGMWRGLGTAAAYAGGANQQQLKTIYAMAGPYRPQLAAGALMAAVCRTRSGDLTEDAEHVCHTWCNMPAKEIIALAERKKNDHKDQIDNFEPWISEIETDIFSAQQLIEL